jgi:hypothetical protein
VSEAHEKLKVTETWMTWLAATDCGAWRTAEENRLPRLSDCWQLPDGDGQVRWLDESDGAG